VVVAAELHHREDEEGHPDREGDPDAELGGGDLDVEAVGVDVVRLEHFTYLFIQLNFFQCCLITEKNFLNYQ
jgi:hypothetical protein